MKSRDAIKIKEYYSQLYSKYGYSPSSIACFTDKRNIRYFELIRHLEQSFPTPLGNESKSFLDFGCGFGDFVGFLRAMNPEAEFKYLGLDSVKEFIVEGIKQHVSMPRQQVKYQFGDFLEANISENSFDYAIASGIFNLKRCEDIHADYNFLRDTIHKMYCASKKGISFNFIVDKVEFKKDFVAYFSPETLLSYAYELTNRVIYNNSYMPFEATITLLKEDEWNKESMLFCDYESVHKRLFEDNIFVVEEKKAPEYYSAKE